MSVQVRKRVRGSGVVWYARLRIKFPDGRVLTEEKATGLRTREDAERWGRARERQLLNCRESPPLFKDFVATFVEWSLAKGNRISTVDTKRRDIRLYLLPVVGDVHIDRIGDVEANAIVARMVTGRIPGAKRKTRKAKTIRNALGVLHAILALAYRRRLIEYPPIVEMPAVPEPGIGFLTAADVPRFLAGARPEHRLLLTTAIFTGMRSGELRALRWSDIDFERAQISVTRSRWREVEGTTKTGKSRVVVIPRQLAEALRENQGLSIGYVFTDAEGKPLTVEAVKKMAPEACARAGMKRVTMHQFRHSYASLLTMAGVQERAVQALLGHATATMTRRYAHLTPDYLRGEVESVWPTPLVGAGLGPEGKIAPN